MDNQDIMRVVIYKGMPPENTPKIEYLLALLKLDVDLTYQQMERGLLTKEKLEKKEKIWNATYDNIAKLSGFDSFDDMRYYVENFLNK